MKKLSIVALGLGSFLVLSGPAFGAVTVINETGKKYTVTFDLGAKEIKHEVDAKGTVKESCPEGCGVRFGGHDAMAKDGDTLVIKEGALLPLPKK